MGDIKIIYDLLESIKFHLEADYATASLGMDGKLVFFARYTDENGDRFKLFYKLEQDQIDKEGPGPVADVIIGLCVKLKHLMEETEWVREGGENNGS